jgi:hypothetical protein
VYEYVIEDVDERMNLLFTCAGTVALFAADFVGMHLATCHGIRQWLVTVILSNFSDGFSVLVSIVVVECLILDVELKSIISRVCLLPKYSVIISDACQTKSHDSLYVCR